MPQCLSITGTLAPVSLHLCWKSFTCVRACVFLRVCVCVCFVQGPTHSRSKSSIQRALSAHAPWKAKSAFCLSFIPVKSCCCSHFLLLLLLLSSVCVWSPSTFRRAFLAGVKWLISTELRDTTRSRSEDHERHDRKAARGSCSISIFCCGSSESLWSFDATHEQNDVRLSDDSSSSAVTPAEFGRI